jgi:hypothetical protein
MPGHLALDGTTDGKAGHRHFKDLEALCDKRLNRSSWRRREVDISRTQVGEKTGAILR